MKIDLKLDRIIKGLKMDYNGIMISGCVAVFVQEMCNDY